MEGFQGEHVLQSKFYWNKPHLAKAASWGLMWEVGNRLGRSQPDCPITECDSPRDLVKGERQVVRKFLLNAHVVCIDFPLKVMFTLGNMCLPPDRSQVRLVNLPVLSG